MKIVLEDHESPLYVCKYGNEQCQPLHRFGPSVKEHYLIHYVHSGKGRLVVGKEEYQLKKSDAFFIAPNIICLYEADEKEPWNYSWVGFKGAAAGEYLEKAGFLAQEPVLSGGRSGMLLDFLNQLRQINPMTDYAEPRLTGLLYVFLSHLMELKQGALRSAQRYIPSVVAYIRSNYERKITVRELADFAGLNRSYLYSLFKKQMGVSPQEYLQIFRIEKAAALMKDSRLLLGDIARSVGFEDALHFSKIFKKIKGLCPRQYRTMAEKEKG